MPGQPASATSIGCARAARGRLRAKQNYYDTYPASLAGPYIPHAARANLGCEDPQGAGLRLYEFAGSDYKSRVGNYTTGYL